MDFSLPNSGAPWSGISPPRIPSLTQMEADINNVTISGVQPADFATGVYPWFNVMDPAYGATGDGSTDDTSAIQAAIDACVSAGGGTVYFPPGVYNVSDTLTVAGPVVLRGSGVGQDSAEAGDNGGVTIIEAVSGIGLTDDVIVFQSATAANIMTGCGCWDMTIRAPTVNPRYGMRLHGIAYSSFRNLHFDNFGGTSPSSSTAAVILEPKAAGIGSHGCYGNIFDNLRIDIAGDGCHGLLLEGETGNTSCFQNEFRRTTIVFGTASGTLSDAVLLNGNVDNNNFFDLHTIRASTHAGFGLNFKDGATSATCRMNRVYKFNGAVNVEANTRGNYVEFNTSEKSSLTCSPSAVSFHYDVRDRGFSQSGMWQTHRYPVQDEVWVGAGDFLPFGSSAHEQFATGPAVAITGAAGTDGATALIPAVHDWSDGTITSIKFYFGADTGSATYSLIPNIGTYADGGATGTNIATGEYTTQIDVASPSTVANIVFTQSVAVSLAYARGDMLKLTLTRTTDTPADDIYLVGVMLVFEADGADSDGQTWDVPAYF